LGAIVLGIMMNPWTLKPGIVFDTRTIFLGISGMFFGFVPNLIAMLMSVSYRIWMGGDGVYTGCSTIVSSIAWGFLFRHYHHKWKHPYGFAEFFSLGILTHITMLWLMLLMPDNIQWDILRIISLPVMTIYPFATVLVGQLTVRSAQRKLARQRLAQSEEEYRLLTETSNDMIVIRDVSGIISFANRKARELLGLSDASVGKVLATDYVLPDYHHFLTDFAEPGVEGYQNHRLFNLKIWDASGKIHVVEVSSTPMLEDGKLKGMLAAMRDVTDRVKTEEQRNRYASRLQILRDLDRIVLETLSFEETCSTAAKKLQELIPFDFMSINVLKGEYVELMEILKPRGRFEYMHKHQTHVPDRSFVDELHARGSMIVRDVEPVPAKMPVRARLTRDGIACYMYNAMSLKDKMVGFLWFGSFQKDYFNQEYLEIAQDFANQLAIVLNHIGLIKTIQEHSEELSKIVAERTAQLQNALQELEAFSYSVAHDLRAPLKLIHGYGKVLEEDYAPLLDEEGKSMLAGISATTHRMDKLIVELLELAKLSPNAIKCETVNMHELVTDIIRALDYSEFEIAIHPLPAVCGDYTLLGQVWQNLVENALKFSRMAKDKRIEIGCTMDDDHITYYVKDNGVGFDQSKAEEIFAPFKRLHNLEGTDGTGIGLAVTKKIVLNHNGKIWAESKPGHGSTFFFSLPAM
ncbi:MAG: ATP-binding protein, partial [Candidatus Cloacimonetes bacterium]|nr:ATP-binding protein [Candidatus Cloacimonadota bacterium]